MDSARRTPKLYSMKLRNTSPTPPRWHYDVFLSFRGEDTRKTFSGDLYKALIEAGIHTFKDDDELPRGNDIPSGLIKAIKESRTSIVVFSKEYASSKWCLDELLEILDSKRTVDQLVFPVFYDVHRDDVRRQTGSFESAFVRHEERFDRIKVEEWRRAMTEAASLDGWEFNYDASRRESEFVQRIVMNVLHKIKRKLFVAKHPVGLDSLIEELKSLLKRWVDNSCVLGVYGISGVGKTTLVKEFYNTITHQYEGSCFLARVGDKLKQPNGLVRLQDELLYELQGKSYVNCDIDKGINLIKVKLGFTKVLIVLDGIDELSQMNSLIVQSSWLGRGSMIVVTSRSGYILDQAQVDIRYEVKELDFKESFMLFSQYAFQSSTPLQSHKDISKEIVNCSARTPLHIEVIGSLLVGKSVNEWKSMLEKLKKQVMIKKVEKY
ncbi:unnamed protein product [Lactuca saligna]|uniref:TIR domain-containing protein n=1 Tax=Lactuca saligna TaxID=75948 RepID=A0AA35ZPV3_LACSI|nr:unnamed protein product [Lactuca saligna]